MIKKYKIEFIKKFSRKYNYEKTKLKIAKLLYKRKNLNNKRKNGNYLYIFF